MKIGKWIIGAGEPAPVQHPPGGQVVTQRWSRSGIYMVRALRPMDRMQLRFMLAAMLGREVLAAMHDVMVLAAANDEVNATNMRRIYDALRNMVARGEPVDRQAVERAAGELWAVAQRKILEVMPDEQQLDLTAFLQKTRPYLAAIAPALGAIDSDMAMDIVRKMLIVQREGGSGLYVRDQPCKDEATINALVPHDEIETIAWWALLLNLRPFTHAGASTAPSSGQPQEGQGSKGPTRSPAGRSTASSTSTGGRRGR